MEEENGFNHSKVLYHFDSPWVLLFCSSGCSWEGGRNDGRWKLAKDGSLGLGTNLAGPVTSSPVASGTGEDEKMKSKSATKTITDSRAVLLCGIIFSTFTLKDLYRGLSKN